MKIAVVGAGYVGLVTGACLADAGHSVVVVNRSEDKSRRLREGVVPFYEPGLSRVLHRALKRKKISFSTNLRQSVKKSVVTFIAVGTPSRSDGSADMSQFWDVAHELSNVIPSNAVIATKSTVPVGTAQKLSTMLRTNTKTKFHVVSCPEFLREGSALKDFQSPDRIIIGADSSFAVKKMLALFKHVKAPKVITGLETAEMIKYASNAFLATKISFINEIANVADRVGANVDEIALGMGLDQRIGAAFLKAGIGYGGSCFPKDVRALRSIAGTSGYSFRLLRSVIEVNNRQREVVFEKLHSVFGKALKGKKITILGLAFKGNTDDIRESAAIHVTRKLVRLGVKVTVYDPQAQSNSKSILKNSVRYGLNAYDAARGADAIVLATEWPQFKKLRWAEIRKHMRRPILVDGKNLLDRKALEKVGFTYLAVGR